MYKIVVIRSNIQKIDYNYSKSIIIDVKYNYNYNEIEHYDYIIIENKNLLSEVYSKYDTSKILTDLIYHDYSIDRAISYKEFGCMHKDLSVVSNWCGGGYTYTMLGITNNGPCVWGYCPSCDEYVEEIKKSTYFTEKISSIEIVNAVPHAKIGFTKILYNHYKNYDFSEIKNLHNTRRKRFNKNKFVVISIAYNLNDINTLNEVSDNHIIFTNIDIKMKNVVSIPNFQMRIPGCQSNELWKYIQRYFTTDFNYIGWLKDSLHGKKVDINNYKNNPMNDIFNYIDNNSSKLIILFSSYIGEHGNLNDLNIINKNRSIFPLYDVTKNTNYNYLLIKDSFSKLYGFFIQHFDSMIFDKLNDKISDFIKNKGFESKDVTSFGFGKGATAALLYSLNNDNINNCYLGSPIINIEFFLQNRNNEIYSYLNHYKNEIKKLFDIKNPANTNLKIVTGIADVQNLYVSDFIEKIESNENIKLNIDININGEVVYFKNEKNDIYQNLYNFISGLDESINNNFTSVSNSYSFKLFLEKYKQNINMEIEDLYIYTKNSELVIQSNNSVDNIYLIHNQNMLPFKKLSYNIHVIYMVIDKLDSIEICYKYGIRQKKIHILRSKIIVQK